MVLQILTSGCHWSSDVCVFLILIMTRLRKTCILSWQPPTALFAKLFKYTVHFKRSVSSYVIEYLSSICATIYDWSSDICVFLILILTRLRKTCILSWQPPTALFAKLFKCTVHFKRSLSSYIIEFLSSLLFMINELLDPVSWQSVLVILTVYLYA